MPALRRVALLPVLAALLLGLGGKPRLRLLVDLAHGRPMHADAALDRFHYDYYEIHNAARMLTHLENLGVQVQVLREGRLTPQQLRAVDLVYLDLPVRPLTAEEQAALEQWVRRGGGLFVVAEHTDAYGSSQILNPLLESFGIQVALATAVDENNVFAFGGWHKLRDAHRTHPAVRGIREVAVGSGAPLLLDPWSPARPQALLSTTPRTLWDTGDVHNPGFHGNFRADPGEHRGAAVQAAAATPGRGRVVVLGDRTAVGNVFFYYADNAAFALRCWDWLSRGRLKLPAGAFPFRGYRILIPERCEPSEVMTPHSFEIERCDEAWFTFFTVLNREPQVIARCADRLEGSYDAVFLPPSPDPLNPYWLEALERHLAGGGRLVLLEDAAAGLSPVARQVLAGLGQPGFEMPAAPPPVTGPARAVVGSVEVSGTFTYRPLRFPGPVPVVEIRAATGRHPVVVEVPGTGGQVQLFLQSGMIQNRAFRTPSGTLLGPGPLRPDEAGLAVYRMVWAWLEELAGRPRP